MSSPTNIGESGRLELIIGPMYASKSTEVIRRVNRYRAKNLRVLVINHVFNNRYGSNHITTHDEIELKSCMNLDKLMPLIETDEYKSSQIIAIEEIQFFPDALEFVRQATDNDHKFLICAGLSCDSEQRKFGQVWDLIAYADDITHLKAFCVLCNGIRDAPFTKRIVESKEQCLVGTQESYIAVCRYHYLN